MTYSRMGIRQPGGKKKVRKKDARTVKPLEKNKRFRVFQRSGNPTPENAFATEVGNSEGRHGTRPPFNEEPSHTEYPIWTWKRRWGQKKREIELKGAHYSHCWQSLRVEDLERKNGAPYL